MVKDIIREIKRKAFQFLAILLITFLGVGFYVGIQVTGYNMRLTGDAYMEKSDMFDYVLLHTLGIDEPLIADVEALVGGRVVGVYAEDMFARGQEFDDVLRVIEYDQHTKRDLTLLEGRMPEHGGEVVVDNQLSQFFNLSLGDTLSLHEASVFESQTVTIVGFVKSSLYLNMERGQTSLGTGTVRGYLYGFELAKIDPTLYTQIRILDATENNVRNTLVRSEEALSAARFERAVAPKRDELALHQEELDQKRFEANQGFAQAELEFEAAQAKLDQSRVQLENGLDDVAGMTLSGSLDERLRVVKGNYARAQSVIQETIARIESEINTVESDEVKAYLEGQLTIARQELRSLVAQYDSAIAQLEAGVKAYNEGEAALVQGRSSFETQKEEALAALDAAQKQIDAGYQTLEKTSHGRLLIQDRQESIVGYREFYDDSYRIENIGKVFPMIFFGVAVLVTLSTMSRMIDESRMQIGVYKALGFSASRISMKYVAFAGMAWLIGASIGLIFGFSLIPNLIYNAYRIMYQTPDMVGGFVLAYAWLPLAMSFLSAAGVAYYKSLRTTREKAANLLRPRAPKKGQRVLLERLPMIWNRLSFLVKVSIRNLFRNKSRFLMTVIGIGGCCGLLITGFGIKHSVFSIVDLQFNHIIQYDGLAFFDSFDLDPDLFDDHVTANVTSIQIDGRDVFVYASDDLEHLGEFIRFQEIKSNETVEIDVNSVLITQKLARLLDVKAGDTLNFNYEGLQVSFMVSNIVENYANHYIYMNKETLERAVGTAVSDNVVFFKSDQDPAVLGEKILASDQVLTVQFLGEMAATYRDMMGSFDIVILVIVACALALEVIVLMNLISMNMSERQKELATLKVLGFLPKELAAYVLRENVLLTLISICFGLVFGRLLHLFVVVSAEIDALQFNREILWTSYVYAMLITFGLSLVLNLFMSRKANRVNMSEALKTFDG